MTILCLVVTAWPSSGGNLQTSPPPIIGRWDITVARPDGDSSAWLEVRHSGTSTLVGQFVGMSGSARPISEVEFTNGEMRFSIPPQWERVDRRPLVTATPGRRSPDRIDDAGRRRADAMDRRPRAVAAARAPPRVGTGGAALQRQGPRRLACDRRPTNGKRRRRAAEQEVWRQPRDRSEFTDFKLHAEFRYPAGSNSGVYLRGRYEVQIADTPAEQPRSTASAPSTVTWRRPNGRAKPRRVADLRRHARRPDGHRRAERQDDYQQPEIPGITGAALDSNEGTPGPLLLQGDHGPIEYRNLTVAQGTVRNF